MKRIAILLVMVGGVVGASAQFLGGFFSQNKTRLQYNEQQIAVLQLYIGYAEKGYKIAETGLNTIGQIKKGEFDLHNAFYSSLEAINPQVGKMAEVAEIIALQVAIIEKFSQALASYRQNPNLLSSEVDYIGTVYSSVLTAGLNDLNALLEITTAGKLKMTDDQRITRIKELDLDMRDQYQFTSSFTAGTDLLSTSRQSEDADIGSIKGWYGLP